MPAKYAMMPKMYACKNASANIALENGGLTSMMIGAKTDRNPYVPLEFSVVEVCEIATKITAVDHRPNKVLKNKSAIAGSMYAVFKHSRKYQTQPHWSADTCERQATIQFKFKIDIYEVRTNVPNVRTMKISANGAPACDAPKREVNDQFSLMTMATIIIIAPRTISKMANCPTRVFSRLDDSLTSSGGGGMFIVHKFTPCWT